MNMTKREFEVLREWCKAHQTHQHNVKHRCAVKGAALPSGECRRDDCPMLGAVAAEARKKGGDS